MTDLNKRISTYPKRNLPPVHGWKRPVMNMGSGEWNAVVKYLESSEVDIRKTICAGCGKAYLYDKNNIRYIVTRMHTLQEAKDIVTKIKSVS